MEKYGKNRFEINSLNAYRFFYRLSAMQPVLLMPLPLIADRVQTPVLNSIKKKELLVKFIALNKIANLLK